MKRGLMVGAIIFSVLFLALGSITAQEPQQQKPPEEQKPAEPTEKPLEPGWFSLDCCIGVIDAKIAEGKGVVQDALGIGIAGYLETTYVWGSRHPQDPSFLSGRYFYEDFNKMQFNDFHIALSKPEKDWGVGFQLSGDFGRTGQLLREATLWGKTFHKEPSAELRESYITTTIPIGAGIQFKGGLFVTPLGTEIIPAPGNYNDTITRSFAFNYAVPLRHLGTLFTYPALKTLSVSGGLVTGWDDPYDNNHAPSFLGGVNFTPMDSFALASNIIVGPEQRGNDGRQRVTWSNVATIKPMDLLTIFLEYTFGAEAKAPTPTGNKDSYWHALAGVFSYNWTDRFNTAFRTEAFFDMQAARTQGFAATSPVHNVYLGEVTFSATYKLTKMFLARWEFRHDWATRAVFKRGENGASPNQNTVAFQLIYTY